ncbi:RNA degradosome polyphosphate kinase [Sphingorhabdus sp. YGSMI21]|uniref:RNA degradosome polyphosphate kinase n=1 Tax=Sphingorhabdus sp. YGSMI21 TaxID=2077182 RepID=UPI000C1E8A55|nr:RNA degradosome polyphosphate kinase [Sphingorhabdus sp. YGSMI21]ATW05215.1 RNA degradosome polyphosphate kinase [Sphingorhabdus sp. YGSMI21]
MENPAAESPDADVLPADTVPVASTEESGKRYFNREISWLGFNERVIEEAENSAHPLLERLRFLSISGNNLDEFFMVRFAGLVGQYRQKIEERSADGLTATQQLEAIAARTDLLIEHQQRVWAALSRTLAEEDIFVSAVADLSEDSKSWLRQHFIDQIFPVLTPQALDPAHPFPFIPNKGLSLVFDLVRESDNQGIRELVMIPSGLARFIRLPGESAIYVSVETAIQEFSDILFPGYAVKNSGLFRIIRDSDIEVEEEAEDLVRYFRSAIKRRRRGDVIRLEMGPNLAEPVIAMLRENLLDDGATESRINGLVGVGDLDILVEEDRPDLKFTPYSPRFPERIRDHGGDCFAAIRDKDILVHHPYESFEVVIEFLRQAAADPDVVAIKQTLYRAGKQSAVIRALIDAAEAGKSVTAIVELKARFDEEQNLLWASALERAGVQVVYGFIEWKTHAKISMVVRKEQEGYRTYCHFGTGNYHPVTAKIYTDLSFFTADPRAARDAAQLFNYITGYVEPKALELISMSPRDMRNDLMGLIDQEIANVRAGKPGMVWAKMNSLVDPALIEKLYQASNAGVEIDLVVRGICCLRPDVPGMSDHIRVKSVVGRFLEHSRIWAFGNGRELPNDGAKLYISSADWMPRNLDRRVEYMMPITNKTVHDQILDQVMVANLIDDEQSWELNADGSYTRVKPSDKPFNLHRYFMTNPSLSGRGKALKKSNAVPRLSLRRRKKKA